MEYPQRVVERVLTRWHLEGDCWVSDYSTGSHGYAQIGWKEGGRMVCTTAHRVAFVGSGGALAPGLTVDHICRRRQCVRPDHLRALTNPANASDNGQENFRTAVPNGRLCRKGHPLVQGGGAKPHCRECVAARKRLRRAL